ncbi:MAG TPA: hypothetical protein VNL73_10990 [Verrucomicrobiae bacterium]|nr:hypothetical protein [Verrucomicrobiae bacterium]
MTASVVFNILVISFVASSAARRFGLLEGKKPAMAKERGLGVQKTVDWPKHNGRFPVLSFEEVKRQAEAHPKARRLISEAKARDYSYGWDFSLHYRPADSAFYHLVRLEVERCDCEGNPFAKTGLQLFLNPYDGRVFFVDTIKNIPQALADKEVKEAL